MLEKGTTVKGGGESDHVNVLQAAAISGSPEMVNLLLDRGADINEQSKLCEEECRWWHGKGEYYASALQAASFYLMDEVVKLPSRKER